MKLSIALWKVSGPSGSELLFKPGPEDTIRKVLTVRQAQKALKLSRRQIYRLIAEKQLTAYEKLLGEWLLDKKEVERLALFPASRHRIPKSFQGFFPEYFIKELNPGRDRILIFSRLMEQGGRKELRWVFKRYSKEEIVSFLSLEGARLLSPKTLNFWALYFKIIPRPLPSWRRRGWAYGAAV